MTDSIRGLWVALATPLDAEGGVDHAALVAHGTSLLAHGADGLVLFGTTGEGTSFSAPERLAAAEALLRAGVAAERVAMGAGSPAITDSIALGRQALGLGVQHLLLLPPYYYRDADAQGIEDAFAAVIDGVGDDRLRATLYHIPQVSGVPVPPEMLARLRARYGRVLAGVKDSTGDFAQFLAFRAAAPDVSVTIGNEPDIGRALEAGGAGTICGMANLVPNMVRAMFTTPGADAAMRQAVGLISGPFVPALKAGLAALTGNPAWARVRAPLRSASAADGERIAAGLRGLQVRKAAA